MNITVVGIGKLGLGFSLVLEKGGFNVLGVDINQHYVDSLNNKTFKTKEPEYEEYLKNSSKFRATTNLQEGLDFSDIIFVIIQTPNSGGDKFYDHTFVSNLLVKINDFKPSNKDIIIGCTVMPNYIDTIGKGLLEDCQNCHLSYNPEFVAQGDIIRGFSKPDIILLGTENDKLVDKIKEIYTKTTISEPKFCILKPLDAEVVKISLNGYITTKLSFANMISDVCDNIGADKNKVLDSIGSDSRIGNKYFRPGYSFGGPCFPRDTVALRMFVEQNNINAKLLRATTEYNQEHLLFHANQLLSQNKEEYLIEDICYKEGSKVPIIEESAKLKIAKILVEKGKKVVIKDEKQLITEVKKEYGNIFKYEIK